MGSSTISLIADSAIGYSNSSGDTTGIKETRHKPESIDNRKGVEFHVVFVPQPEYEVIRIKNISNSDRTIHSGLIIVGCLPTADTTDLPSLTNWGLLVLVLLLILSGAYVIYQRRKGAVRA